jgi:hypothetical protein
MTLVLCAFLALLTSCDPDDAGEPGLRGECAAPGGQALTCPGAPLEDSEDACWKLVECGAIPVSHPEGRILDWGRCVRQIDRLPAQRYDVAMTCLELSSCDQLRFGGSPDAPDGNNSMQMPPCLEYGDRP